MSKQRKNSEYHHLRELLLRKRDDLNQRIEERRQEILIDLEPEDEVGMALRNSSTGMTIANIEREIRELAEIEVSLRRMDAGKYGICGVCGEKIPLARLRLFRGRVPASNARAGASHVGKSRGASRMASGTYR